MKYTATIHKEFIEKSEIVKVGGLRNCKNLSLNTPVRQGDLIFTKVQNNHPRGKEINERQLVLGSTQGSRHIAGKTFKIYEGVEFPSFFTNEFKKIKDCLGPVLVVIDDTDLITHPEHCNYSFSKGDTIQVTYECDLRTLTRIRD